MNEVYYRQTSSTFSYVLLAAGLLALQPNAPANTDAAVHSANHFSQSSYSVGGSESTFNSMRGAITGAYDSNTTEFEQSVGMFYAQLLASQEPLGAKFEKVLYDNLWDLYES